MTKYAKLGTDDNPFNGLDLGDFSAPSLGDIDGDGDLDLIVGVGTGFAFKYFRNTGESSNAEYEEQAGASNPFPDGIDIFNSPSLGDVDGDGDIDLVAGMQSGQLEYFQRRPGSTPVYFLPVVIDDSNTAGSIDVGIFSTPSLGDLDGDGDLDMVVGSLDGPLRYFENIRNGNVQLRYTERTGDDNPFDGLIVEKYSTPSLGDIDGDGDLDLVVGRPNGTFFYFENTGTEELPEYTEKTGAANPFNGLDVGTYSAPTLGDLDGDGTLELVSGDSTGLLQTYAIVKNAEPTTSAVTLTPVLEDSSALTITQAMLLANAADADAGDTLSATDLSIEDGKGTLVDNKDGTWSYTPAANDDTGVSFKYTISDGAGGSVAGSATLDITAVNDAPTTSPVTLTPVLEDSSAITITQAMLLANAADVDSTTLSATDLSIEDGKGSLVDNKDGTWSYTPAANDDTGVSFKYTISDGAGGSVAGSTTLDITAVNDAPTTSAVTLTPVQEDGAAITITQAMLLANAADVDSTTLSATDLSIGTGKGTLVNNNDGSWSYTPAANDDTGVSFKYTISDGAGGSVAGSATLDITAVDDAPTTSAVTLTPVLEDSSALTITQAMLLDNAADVDTGDSLSATDLSISGDGKGTLVDNKDGTWSYTPAANDDTGVSFKYTVSDSTGRTAAGTASLDITAVNDVPTTSAVTLQPILDASAAIHITQALLLANAKDVETAAGSLSAESLSVSSGGNGVLVDNKDGSWSYTPSKEDRSVVFGYTVSDGNGGTVAGSATLDGLTLNGTEGDDVLEGSVLADVLNGLEGNDLLQGGEGNDTLDGGTGEDILIGGAGDDTYHLDSAGDALVEFDGEGNDTVVTASLSLDLSDLPSIENIELTGSAALNATGDDQANRFTGNEGANSLVGGAGNDTLTGAGGNDTLVGGEGADSLAGGMGDDVYEIDSADTVTELGSQGTDTLVTSTQSLRLADFANVENATLTGSSHLNLTGTAQDNVLIGNAGNNAISAGDGNDSLGGGAGNDNLIGAEGNDTLDGGEGTDNLIGGRGDDLYILATAGDRVIESADQGNDTVLAGFTADLGNYAQVENLSLSGSASINGTGNTLDNRLIGNAGNNALSGLAGNDTLTGGAGSDTLDGGTGADTADYAGMTAAVRVRLDGATAATVTVGGVAEDSIRNIENVIGGSGADTLEGDALANDIQAGAGNDELRGFAGQDTLDGGAGIDRAWYTEKTQAVSVTLNGATAATVTVGGVAEDSIRNIENVVGGSGNDTLVGDALANSLSGWSGNDTLTGGAGRDTLDGGTGADTADYAGMTAAVRVRLDGATAATVTVGGVAEDSILNIENVIGGSGADTLEGDALANDIQAGAGNDELRGHAGQDTLDGGAGIDRAWYTEKTQAVSVTLNGATAATVTVGGVAEDSIRNIENVVGGSGNDTLVGDALANSLSGWSGNDTLTGADGNDTLDGGEGLDSASYAEKTQAVSVTLNGATAATVTVGGLAEDSIRNIENLTGGSGNDSLTGDAQANALVGGAGNDTLTGGAGRDTLDGGTGADTSDYAGMTAAVRVRLDGATAATVTVGGVAEDSILNIENVTGGSGADTLEGDALANDIQAGAGNDELRGYAGQDTLDGGAGIDRAWYTEKTQAVSVTLNGATAATVTVGGVAEDSIRNIENVVGGSGNDTLVGDALANSLSGWSGNDTLDGGAGVDTLTGGLGADAFVFGNADLDTTAGAVTDVVSDFATGSDRLQFNATPFSAAAIQTAGTAAASLGALLAAADTALDGNVRYYLGQVGADAYLVTDQDGQGYTDVIRLTGVTHTSLTATDLGADITAPDAPGATLAADTGSSSTDRLTNNGQIDVTLESGASWQYSTDAGKNWSAGSGTSFTLAEGSYLADDVQVKQTDVAGNTGAVTKLAALTVDTSVTAPSATLANDTGLVNSDRITSNGQITVGNLDSGNAWAYSTDGGSSWSDGSGTSFTLAEGSYAASAVQVKQTDAAGNDGIVQLAAITIDRTAPVSPVVTFAQDTGSSDSDGITSNGVLKVSALEEEAIWQYSLNSGKNWTLAATDSFTLAAGSYAANAVQVRQVDTAGNTSTVTKLGAITVDSTAPAAPTATLASDTGSSASDGITGNGQINVGGLEVGASWEYSTDGGKDWSAGTNTSFTLADASYAADTVQVRQLDKAGNLSTVTKLAALTVDTTAPDAPTATLAEDTGSSDSDGITTNGKINLSGLESGASWEYSTDAGKNWTAGSGTSFTLPLGSYAAESLQGRQIDIAGNISAVTKLGAITVEDGPRTLQLTTATDDNLIGGSDKDTVNGAAGTLQTTDSVDTGADVDTANLAFNSEPTPDLSPIKNVEKFFIKVGAGTTTLDFSKTAGETEVWNDSSARSVIFSNLGTGTVVGVKGDGSSSFTSGTILTMATATDAVSIALDGGVNASSIARASGQGDVDVAISSTGKANSVAVLDLNNTGTPAKLNISIDATTALRVGLDKNDLAALSKLTIQGDGAVTFTGVTSLKNLTVDATASKGGVTLTALSFTTFNGGSGNDTVILGDPTTSSGGNSTLNGGGGNDVLMGSNRADKINGGEGNDTIYAHMQGAYIPGSSGGDTLTGGLDADSFVMYAADLDINKSVTNDMITITDFGTGADQLVLGFGAANAKNFVKATAEFASVDALLTEADTALNGTVKYYLGQVAGEAYLVTDNDGNGRTDFYKFTGKLADDISMDNTALIAGFNDPLLRAQWYIKNVGQRAATAAEVPATLLDLNVEKAWQQGFTGKGVRVGVSDDGMDLNHPDLQAALLKDLTKNYITGATGANAYDSVTDAKAHSHGTVVGSIVAMTANNAEGMVGIAHGAQLVSTLVVADSANSAGNFSYLASNGVGVSINSYGNDPAFSENYYIAPGTADSALTDKQKEFKDIEAAATTGRDGKGMVIEVSAGNERSNNADAGMTGFTSNRFVITSGSMTETGKYASYTTPGASVLVSAFGGENPTDQAQSVNAGFGAVSADVSGDKGYNTTAGAAGNYSFQNTGTSYSGPMVGAVAALMLQANPGLGFRDVSTILALTARGVGATDNNYVTTKTTDWNMGGMHFSRDVGFGLVDASAAVHMAQSWLKVPGNVAGTVANWQMAEGTSANAAADIPDNDTNGLTVTANITDNVRIERMEFDLKLTATSPSQLKAEVTSAAGTTITLFDGPLTLPTKNNTTGNFEGTESAWPDVFQIGSTAFLGENSQGTWTLKLTDKVTGEVAQYESLTVRAWGSAITDDTNHVFTNEFSGSKVLTDTVGNDTINASAVGTNVIINLNAGQVNTSLVGGGAFTIASGSTIENAFGGMGNDTLTGNFSNNLLRGGWGLDNLNGGGGQDTFLYSLGDASPLLPTSGISQEKITGYISGSGIIDFDIDLSKAAAVLFDTADTRMAQISANGQAFFAGATTSLADQITAVINTLGDAAAGTAVVWQHTAQTNQGAANVQLLVSDGVAGLSQNDTLIGLVGVSTNAFLGNTGGLTITDGNLTVFGSVFS